MRSNLFLTCLPLLLIALIGTIASPIASQGEESHVHALIPRKEWGTGDEGIGGLGGGSDPFINTNTPLCDIHTGFGNIDGVHRTNHLEMSRTNFDPSLREWQGTMPQQGGSASLHVKINSDRMLEIMAWNGGYVLPGKFEVSMQFDQKAVNPIETKYYLNTNKGTTCHVLTGHTPGYYSGISVAY